MAVIWKLTKRVVIPAGAVVSIPFVVPLMYASDNVSPDPSEDSGNLVKPNDLPIYDGPTKSGDETPAGPQQTEREPGYLLQGVSSVRKSIFNSVAKLDESKDSVLQYYEIGKDHTSNAYSYLTAEDNVIPRAIAITVGGLSGLLFSARKGVFKKAMYTTTGLAGMSFVCYPKQATQVSLDAYKIGKYYVLMAYSKWQESGSKETKLHVPAVSPQPPPPPPPPPEPTKPPVVPNYSFVDKMTEQAAPKNREKQDLLDQSNPADRDLYTARKRLM